MDQPFNFCVKVINYQFQNFWQTWIFPNFCVWVFWAAFDAAVAARFSRVRIAKRAKETAKNLVTFWQKRAAFFRGKFTLPFQSILKKTFITLVNFKLYKILELRTYWTYKVSLTYMNTIYTASWYEKQCHARNSQRNKIG